MPPKRISSRLLSKGHFTQELSFVQAGFATPDGTPLECPICREMFSNEDVNGMASMDGPPRYAKMDCCDHAFHVACLEHWSTQRENSCPSCRATIHYVAEYSLYKERSNGITWRLIIEQVIQVQEAKQADTLYDDEGDDGVSMSSSEESIDDAYRCVICGNTIIQAAPADQRGTMLLCDAELPVKKRKGKSQTNVKTTCDVAFHPFCAGYDCVPDGEVFCPKHSHLLPSPNEEELVSPESSPTSSSSPEATLDEPCTGQPKDIIELGTSSSDEDEKEVTHVEKPKLKETKIVLPTYISVTAPGNSCEVAIEIAITNSVVEGHRGDETGLVREVKKGVVTAMLSWKDRLVERSVVSENGRGLLKLSFVDNTIVTAKSVCKILRSLKAAQISYDKKIEKLSGAKQTKLTWFLSELDISGTNLNPMEVGEVSSLLMKLSPSLWPSVHSIPLTFRALKLARLSSGGKMPAAAKLKTAGVDVEIGRTEEPEPELLIGAIPRRKARTVGRRGRRTRRQSVQWRPMKASSDSENEGLKDTLRQAANFELRLKRADEPRKDTSTGSAPAKFSLSKLLGAQTVYQKNIRQPLKGLSYLGAPPKEDQRHAPQNYPEKRPHEPSSSSTSRADVSIDSTVVNFVAHVCKDRRLLSWPSHHFDEEVRKVSRMLVEKYSCLLPHDGNWKGLIEKRKKRLAEWVEEKICSRRVAKNPEKINSGNSGAKFRKIGLG